MKGQQHELDLRCVNTIRTLAIDTIEKANSGHPGLPLGAAPMAYVLWQNHLRHNPRNPDWPDRDRFVLSAGHGSALIYVLLHLTGYDLSMDDLQAFRQWGSITPGHPESTHTPGVEATTGPLGQGTGNAVGMAIAERHLARRFNRPGHTIVDHHTYALVSDGDLMEGISAEASALAGHLKLGKLLFLYDANEVSLDGPSSLAFSTEDTARRYRAYGWQVLRVRNGNEDLKGIRRAIVEAKKDTEHPTLIIIQTVIGYGSPGKQGTHKVHGAPLGREEMERTKQNLGCDPEKMFCIPEDALNHFRTAVARGRELEKDWKHKYDAYANAFPDLAKEWERALAGKLPDGWDDNFPDFPEGESVATRAAGGKVMNAIALRVPELIGGDADLSESTKTALKDAGDFNGQTGEGRNLHFGVREHAMGAIANGMAYHGGVRPYTATFFVFADYMRPAVRLAAMNGLPVIYVWTHDSIAVGEDGPTHQPVEHLMSLRVIPSLKVVRPADANETIEAWKFAMRNTQGPTALVLTRQNVPTLGRGTLGPAEGLTRGAYILADAEGGEPDGILMATGSEVHPALEARELLAKEGIQVRVVSMPCWEEFDSQDEAYRESVLPQAVTARVSVEAGVTMGWSRWTGTDGLSIGIDRFGSSAPAKVNLEKYGITAERIAGAMKTLLRGK